jgi:hypothetical protein
VAGANVGAANPRVETVSRLYDEVHDLLKKGIDRNRPPPRLLVHHY